MTTVGPPPADGGTGRSHRVGQVGGGPPRWRWPRCRAGDRTARRPVRVELVSVDSMAVYRGMDIGTAKPTPEERARRTATT